MVPAEENATVHEFEIKNMPKTARGRCPCPTGESSSSESKAEAWKALRERSGQRCVWLSKVDGSGVTDYLEAPVRRRASLAGTMIEHVEHVTWSLSPMFLAGF